MATNDVLIIAHFTGAGPSGNNRFHDLARRLRHRGASVELVTSSFDHGSKMQRAPCSDELDYRLTYVYEPGYGSNVSLSRMSSHRRFAANLETYLEHRAPPDLIYCAVPSLDAGDSAARYAGRHAVRFVIDIQDLWPEAFSMVLPRMVPGWVFHRMKRAAARIYSAADVIVGVSSTYTQRALRDHPACDQFHTVYLGTNLGAFPDAPRARQPVGREDTLRLAYIGTLGRSYDLVTAMHALRLIKDQTGVEISFEILGSGAQESALKELARNLEVDATFHGRLPYEEMAEVLVDCDIGLNPIVSRSAASVINKVCDYAAAGLPVLNSQESVEYRELLAKYRAGINYRNGDAADLARGLRSLIEEPVLRHELGRGNRVMAEELFDRAVSYERLTSIIIDVSGDGRATADSLN